MKPFKLNEPSCSYPIDNREYLIVNPEGISGSERLQLEMDVERRKAKRTRVIPAETIDKAAAVANTFCQVVAAIPAVMPKKKEYQWSTEKMVAAVRRAAKHFPKGQTGIPTCKWTKADMGQVTPPSLREVSEPLDHWINAFLEFKAIIIATRQVNIINCKTILQIFHRGYEDQLVVKLEEAEAAVYNNDTGEVIKGNVSGQYMAAYNETGGFVALDRTETKRLGQLVFRTPPHDPIVVTAKCTRVMLEEEILDRLKAVSMTLEEGGPLGHWQLPKITWVNGVPGCGKTSWVIDSFEAEKDVIITTTTVAASDLRERLASRVGADAARKVRTMASILVNGIRASEKYTRLLIDEALMNHFGAIVTAVQITGASEILLIGDNNQLPYIDRHDLFRLYYTRPNLVANINHEWLCTHRNPLDVAYALNEIYSGIYSSNTRLRSLVLKSYTGSQIPKSLENALYLGHTQAEKENLINQGYGKGKGSRTLTIHEAQGLVSETVIIVRSAREKQRLYNSIPHAVVAISRHTSHCIYYTDWCEEDAVARFILRAESATTNRIRDYNIKMAIQHRDLKVASNIMNVVQDEVV